MFAGKKSAQIREILISESAWEEMTCLFAPSLDTTPQMAYEDISRSLTELQPITFQSGVEKYKILVFVDNQCV
ncbi:hypothetical protein MU434_31525, partial [Klebsiella quasipneumoniae subsp. similipneumoniae]|nr:hypothetical protein [Klebsiella quasipneumoniae subsp. similipneumoniae]